MTELDVAALAERAAAGDFSDLAVRRWLADGMEAFLRADGTVPLEQCLRLPKSEEAQRLARRNRALRRAARLLPRESLRATCIALELNWSRFVVGPMWRAWRDDDAPPEGTAGLYCALFDASRAHRSSARGTLGVRQLRTIIEGNDEDV